MTFVAIDAGLYACSANESAEQDHHSVNPSLRYSAFLL
jgi:hypothetical protein